MASTGYLNKTSYNSIAPLGTFSASVSSAVVTQPSVSWSPNPMETTPGQVNMAIGNCQAGETITISLDGTAIQTVVADAIGQWSGSVSIPSTAANPVVRTNLATHPQCDATGTRGDFGVFTWAPNGSYTATTGTGPISGLNTYITKTVSASGTGGAPLTIPFTAADPTAGSCTPPSFAVQADTTYTISMYLRTNLAHTSLSSYSLIWRTFDQSGAAADPQATISFASTVEGAWTRVSFTFTTGHNATLLAAVVQPNTPYCAVGDTMDVTGIMVEAASSMGSYFDGALNAPSGYSVYWTGNPDASSSQMRATHTLQVGGTSSPAVTGLFQINNTPLSLTVPAGPGSFTSSVVKWVFTDTRTGSPTPSYTFTKNPSGWVPPVQVPILSTEPTTAPGGNILTWEGGAEPAPFEFSGHVDTQYDYSNLDYWVNLKRRFWLTDHRGVQRLITLLEFDAVPRLGPNPWSHDYTIRGLQFTSIGAMA